MNTRSRKTKGFSQRLIALLLCGVCLLSASPVSAMASEVEAPQTAEESTTVVVEAVPQPQTENQEMPKQEPDQNPPAADPQKEAAEQENVQQEPVEQENADELGSAQDELADQQPTEKTETVPDASLYDRLLACSTVQEMDSLLNNLTEEEQLALDAFTEEQNAALSAKLSTLGGYDAVLLDDTTVEQGESLTYTLTNASSYTYKLRSDGSDISFESVGITVTTSGNQLVVQPSASTPAGEYEVVYGTIEWFRFFWYFDEKGSVALTVTAKQQNVPVTNTKRMTYDKTVKSNAAGNYDLELTLSGAMGTKENKAKVDLVIVIDGSNSMFKQGNSYNNNATRIKNARTAAKNLITTLGANEKIDARYNIVRFDGSWNKDGELVNNCTSSYGWTSSGTTATGNVDSITRNTGDGEGGTNYEAGLRQAQNQINSARAGATKIVVFLTDGKATFRSSDRASYNPDSKKYEDGRQGYGTGNEDKDNTELCLNAAKTYAATMTMNRFYVVGFGSADSNDMSALANAATNASVKKYYTGSDSQLTTIFNDIAGEITTFLCENVTITDTLAHKDGELMVQVTDPSTVKVKVLDKDGKVIAGPAASVQLSATKNNSQATLTTSYDAATGLLKLDFPDSYKLEADYTYVLCAEIAPTEKAYQEYRKTGYTNIGDANTGTHSGKPGFYSNDVAKVDYTYDGSNGSVTYDKPVVQLNPGKLIITKTFEGLTDDQIQAMQNTLTFKIMLTYPTPTGLQKMEIPLSAFQYSEADKTYTYTVTGLSPNTAYTVAELGADLDGHNVTTTVTGSESGTVAKDATVTVGYQNSYGLANTTASISKRVIGNMGDHRKAFPFTVTVDRRMTAGEYPATTYSVAYTVADNGENGSKITFRLKHGQKVIIANVPIGAAMTIVEADNFEYAVSVGDTTLKNQLVDNSATYSVSSVTKDMKEIQFVNSYDVSIETGVLLDSLPYVLILGLVVAGAVLLIGKRRNRYED